MEVGLGEGSPCCLSLSTVSSPPNFALWGCTGTLRWPDPTQRLLPAGETALPRGVSQLSPHSPGAAEDVVRSHPGHSEEGIWGRPREG